MTTPIEMSAFTGQGWWQMAELLLVLALSALVWLERELRQKTAGLRTHIHR